jgi:hypothetical protein
MKYTARMNIYISATFLSKYISREMNVMGYGRWTLGGAPHSTVHKFLDHRAVKG